MTSDIKKKNIEDYILAILSDEDVMDYIGCPENSKFTKANVEGEDKHYKITLYLKKDTSTKEAAKLYFEYHALIFNENEDKVNPHKQNKQFVSDLIAVLSRMISLTPY